MRFSLFVIGAAFLVRVGVSQQETKDSKKINFFATDRAKQIKTKATVKFVNEDPAEELLRELKEGNETFKKSMAGGKVDMSFVDGDGDNIDNKDDRAKQIKTKAIVNEDPTEKLLRS